MFTRRKFLTTGATLAGGAAVLANAEAAPSQPANVKRQKKPYHLSAADYAGLPPGQPGKDYTPVVTPNNVSLPWKIVDGVKVFHMVAEPVDHEFAPGLKAKCWGYNGRVHGPTIEAVEGDRVRIYVTNKLPAGTTVHWHGILLPNGMDGVGGLNQKVIQPGETFMYEFTLVQHGTHMYHSHHDEMTQMGLGTVGPFVIHPRNPARRQPDRDFVFMLHEWRIDVGSSRPNPNEMTDFNIFTFNAKSFPGTEPMVAKLGEHVRIRLINLGAMSHHPIHLHGYQFPVVETDGGQIPDSAQQLETSVLTAVGQSRAFEFIANEPGDWAMHCHMTHHVMNQMGHDFPNMIGVNPGDLDRAVGSLIPGYMTMGADGMGEMGQMSQTPTKEGMGQMAGMDHMAMPVPPNSIPMVGGPGPFDYITMGGLFTVLKVRENLTSYDDPGWYEYPEGTVASLASAEALARDGIDPGVEGFQPPQGGHSTHTG
ncbi:MAG: copper oxidase [Gammaproteobacteria bacterium]|nr:copper oxidase [Gammaproteobacteria bacterium]MBA3731740.1 copper oxidase [Gammaproteobacteria bacterium]